MKKEEEIETLDDGDDEISTQKAATQSSTPSRESMINNCIDIVMC